ncbi:MAG TPA: hypothetical protein PLS94_09570 [Prolixibacteraceae bacterium]|nr:hypothetical protein [Prolixibacteraceae bacterium]
MKHLVILFVIITVFVLSMFGQKSRNVMVLETNAGALGQKLEIHFQKGKSFKDPTFAFWIEDMEGNYIETLYVTQYLATGVYKRARLAEGRPLSRPGFAKRPSTLPNWLHKRNDGSPLLPTPDKPVPDALTGATPKSNFILKTVSVEKLPKQFVIMMEINQPFDYNEVWTKVRYPDEFDYSYSAQPALVYSAQIDADNLLDEYIFELKGHSHYSGKDGRLYTNMESLSTALDIVDEVKVLIK